MIIKESRNRSKLIRTLRVLFSRRLVMILGVTLLVLAATAFILSRKYQNRIQEQGFKGSIDFVTSVTSNYLKGLFSKTPDLVIDMKHRHFQKLNWKRQLAIERGVIVNEGDGWVPASISYKGKTYDVEMRLKGHMTDHIQGDKWSFRVKVEGDGSIEGMRRISLQHPGTRGYINEWIYHQLQKQEGMIALRYLFVDVTLNGKDLGIYALEENFDEELVENNARPQGPVMRFNPDLYWSYRLREIHGSHTEHDYGTFTSAVLEPYRFDKTLEDPSMHEGFLRALDLMEGFRSRKFNTSQVFDLDLMANFHAIIDLMGGHHSLDWSDVKFYYNKVSGKLEPVAYESFGILPAWTISGARHFKPENPTSYHQLLFSDTTYFQKYIAAVERVSRKEYLDDFFSRNDSALQSNLASLYREFPYKKYRKDLYYENQKRMREFLHVPSAIHPFLKDSAEFASTITVASSSNLPIVVDGVIDGKTFYRAKDFVILPVKEPGENMALTDVVVEKFRPGKADPDSLFVKYHVLGSSVIDSSRLRLHRAAMERPELSFPEVLSEKDFPFLRFDSTLKRITFIPGKVTINKNISIPAGWTLFAGEGVEIILDSARIFSSSAIHFKGSSETQIKITLQNGSGITIMEAGNSIFQHVKISSDRSAGEKGASSLTFYNTSFTLRNFSIRNSGFENAIGIYNCKFLIEHALIDSVSNDGADMMHSTGSIKNSFFKSCGEDAVNASFSTVNIENCVLTGTGNHGVNAKAGSVLTVKNIKVQGGKVAVYAEDESVVKVEGAVIDSVETAFRATRNKDKFGAAFIQADNVKISNAGKEAKVSKGGKVQINGRQVAEIKEP